MSQQYKAVAALIKNTIAGINELLSDPNDELHRLSVTGDLQRSHDRLLLLTGTGDLETGKSAILGPAKTIGGVPIAKQRKFTEADLVPSDDKVFKLKQDIEDALASFAPEASAEGILANIPELIIRGVAKKAGLKVTKDEPAEITVEFIEQAKEALLVAGLTSKENSGPVTVVEGDSEPSTEKSFDEVISEQMQPIKADEDSNATAGSLFNETIVPAAEEPKQETKPDTKKKAGK